MTSEPLVSVVTASYNMGHYVTDAVESVLAQDYANLEIIVVDDGSTDDTPAILARYENDDRVTVIRQENCGQTVAKNRGLSVAKGDYVGFCDADNLWKPGKLAKQLESFRQNPDAGVVYGDIDLIDGDGQPVPGPGPETKRFSGRITPQLLVENFVTFNTTLVPRKILEEVGGFDEDLQMAIDYDLWLRISLKYDFILLDEPLVDYRIWGGQMSHRTGERMDNFFRLLKKFLADNPDAVSGSQARHAWSHSYTTRGVWLARTGRKSEAWADYLRAFSKRPYDKRLLKAMLLTTLGRIN